MLFILISVVFYENVTEKLCRHICNCSNKVLFENSENFLTKFFAKSFYY